MSSTEASVASHYTTGALLDRIKAGLVELGVSPDTPTPADLKPVDEFHTGGLEATEALLDQLAITSKTRVLDIGSGIGGTARYLAARHGCWVTGIDLTPEYVETATALSALVKLGDKMRFIEASALDLPVDADSVDLVTMFHVGMNIADKTALFASVARVLRPGGTFALFDVMRGPADSNLVFPLPWSSAAETSFVAPPADYRAAGAAAGLTLTSERDRVPFALQFMRRAMEASKDGPPPLGIHLLMGPTAREKLTNYVANLEADRIMPVEMIFEKPTDTA